MKWIFLTIILVCSLFIFWHRTQASSADPTKYWQIQSIDTMKYSRDTAGAKVNDPSFDSEIQTQVQNIATSGANYVAIDTPYDEQFYPYLARWVNAARKNHLHVWFRGNFSAWEGWFGVKQGMSLADHTQKSADFIRNHPDLFEDGDIFSSCPECENGSFGDPRQTGKVQEYRQFMVSETAATEQAFRDIHKKVASNYWSMNLDVAKLIMDKDTSQKLGGVVVIDHYVSDPKKLVADAEDLAQNSGAKIMLGEFGAPIPDINGKMTDQQQADFLEQVLGAASKSPDIFAVNYWTSNGGTTAIWDDNNNPKPAVVVISKYFNPPLVSGKIIDEFDNPVADVSVKTAVAETKTDAGGTFKVIKSNPTQLIISKDGYDTIVGTFPDDQPIQITLVKTNKSLLENIQLWMKDHNISFSLP